MTFPAYWLFGFLNYAGWPRTKGILIRKKVVSSVILRGGLVSLVRAGIALGALRPKTAVRLLADLFSKRDWPRQPATEAWAQFDPSEKIANTPDKPPEEVIAGIQSPMSFFNNKPEKFDNILKDVIEWEFIFTDEFSAYYHLIFGRGIIWGLSHPREALARYEEKRQHLLKKLPEMLQAGLEVHPLETLEEFADSMEESVNVFQKEIRPFVEIPQELLSIPVIDTRLNSI
ncbi:hypothetical protein MUP06_00245 [Patescibacteria group bacterium]|nr:hypothetical protein [Patescibacteria group bacterium]